jgi:hypothetical protein
MTSPPKQFGLCKKKIKDVYPKKVDHMLMEYVKKKREREERKDAYLKKLCHMLAMACQKKYKYVDSPRWK